MMFRGGPFFDGAPAVQLPAQCLALPPQCLAIFKVDPPILGRLSPRPDHHAAPGRQSRSKSSAHCGAPRTSLMAGTCDGLHNCLVLGSATEMRKTHPPFR